MELETAIRHFESQTALAAALKVTPQAVCNWKNRPKYVIRRGKKRKPLVPKAYALELHYLTNGELRFDPKAYENS